MRLSERDGARPQSPLLHFGWSLPLVKAIQIYYFAEKPPLTGRLFLYPRTLKIAVCFACAAGSGALPRTPVLRGRRQRDLSLWNPVLACGRDGRGQSRFCMPLRPAKATAGRSGRIGKFF